MKSMKRILLFIFILIGGLIFSAYAGNGGEIKGMLVTASYDTLNGFIKKVPDKKLFMSLKFRTSLENEYRDYRPEQIEAFISDEISLFSHRICLNNVSRYIFIKKIYDGKIDLYYSWLDFNSDLIINGNDLYFAGFEDGKIIHLQKQFMIKTLTAIFWDSDCVLEEIETDRFDYYYYKYNKLFHLFETYDACSNPSLAMKTRSKKVKDFNSEL
jgi:hypothetical protein